MLSLPELFRLLLKPNRARRRPLLITSCSVQMLEDRALLAGNVVAGLLNGTLTVSGDLEGNSVEIVLEAGNVVVRGLDGTTVNGNTTAFATGANTIQNDLR